MTPFPLRANANRRAYVDRELRRTMARRRRRLYLRPAPAISFQGLTSVYLLRYCKALLTLFFHYFSSLKASPTTYKISEPCGVRLVSAHFMERERNATIVLMERERPEIKRAPLELIRIIPRQKRHNISISRNTQVGIIPP